ncbi:MAG: DNA mismatch repair protein MutS, partial [Simkania negevensis]|nr:DNA mismatch repair protein MutS [Simkania negevensis]
MKLPFFSPETLTPMMAQWYHCKQRAKEALLLFRLGDFYEAFYDDAAILARELNLTLTKRGEVPMSGIPAHTVENYVEKIIKKGYLVAIAEQMEDPRQVKGLVKREVVQILSPATFFRSSFIEKGNNFFASLAKVNASIGLALLDLSTGEFHVMEIESLKALEDEIFRRSPSEILLSQKDLSSLTALLEELKKQLSFRLTVKEPFWFDHKSCLESLTSHFKLHTLDGFGLKGLVAAVNAAGALFSYVDQELRFPTSHIKKLELSHLSHYMSIDKATQRNLEICHPLHSSSNSPTLLSLLDQTKTAMGGRLLKSWVSHPLLEPKEIWERQKRIEILHKEPEKMEKLSSHLKEMCDLERLSTKVSAQTINPKELLALSFSLKKIPEIKRLLEKMPSFHLIYSSLEDPIFIVKDIEAAIDKDCPSKWGEGRVIRAEYDVELDQLRFLKEGSQHWILSYQEQLKETSGIKNLRISYSKAFGYCIEVSRGQADKVPQNFERRQTLTNCERYVTYELKAYEEKVLTAQEQIEVIEKTLYLSLLKKIGLYLEMMQKIAEKVASLDAILSLAEVAIQRHYVCPRVDDGDQITIEGGRHPVIESALPFNSFIPNDTLLDLREQRLLLITGPNMAGKSTYIRQVALIAIMAQTGSFVPAKSAHIGIIDKVFSRIGASDDLSQGHSTFMVEMSETANIVNNASPRSLIILDEIGRGTSTYDGISIAWAVAEHLLSLRGMGVKTLFATHYWELTRLEEELPGAINYHIAVEEIEDSILFLRKIK